MVRNDRLRAQVKIIYCDPVDLLHHLDFAMKVTKPRIPSTFTVVLSGLSKATLTSPTNKLNCRKPEAPSMVSAVALASVPQALRLVPWWLHSTAWLSQNCNMNEEQDLPESHKNFWTEARLDFIWHTKQMMPTCWSMALEASTSTSLAGWKSGREGCREGGQDHHTSFLPTWSASQFCSQLRTSVLFVFLLGTHCLWLLINQFHVN